jgi:hypothetical protein
MRRLTRRHARARLPAHLVCLARLPHCRRVRHLGGGEAATARDRLDRHRRHGPGRLPVDGPPPAVRGRVGRRRPGLIALRAGAARAHPGGDRSLCRRLPGAPGALEPVSASGRPAPPDLPGGGRPGAVRGRVSTDGGLRRDRPGRPAGRRTPAPRARLGWPRGSRAGPPRRARHPAGAAGLLDRRPEQEMEPRRLSVPRRSPSRPVDHRGQRHLRRLVRRRRSGRRVGQPGVRRDTRERPRGARPLLRQSARRVDEDGRYAVRRPAAAGRAGRPVAAGMGWSLRARVGPPVRPVRSAAHDRGSDGAVRHPRARPAAGGGCSGDTGSRARRREPVARRACRERRHGAIPVQPEGREGRTPSRSAATYRRSMAWPAVSPPWRPRPLPHGGRRRGTRTGGRTIPRPSSPKTATSVPGP